MDFSDALKLVKAGTPVTRKIWKSAETARWAGAQLELDTTFLTYSTSSTSPSFPLPLLVVVYPTGEKYPFSGGQWDLLADDWEVA